MTETDSPSSQINAIDILIEGGEWDERHHGAIITETAQACAAYPGVLEDGPVDLSVLLTIDAAIAALNTRWRGKPGATNVLSFPALGPALGPAPGPAPGSSLDREPAGGAPRLLGDLVFAWETIVREAAEQDKRMDDHFRHLVVHGVLHLCGFDHLDDAEAEDMEQAERTILAGFGVADPYAEDGQARPGQPSSGS